MYKKLIAFCFVGLLLFGCKTDFSINGEYIEKPVVHFILDQGEEYHFLKLNKTFLKEGNALEFAKDPELSYFDDVHAVVQEVKNGNVTEEWILEDTTIHNKKEGVFYAPNQKLYFFKATLDEDAIYRLKIDIDNGNHIVEGQTALVKGMSIKSPKPQHSFKFADNNVLANGYKNTPISFFQATNASIYKMQLNIYYDEHTTSGSENKILTWNLGEMVEDNIITSNPTIFAEGERFYEYLQNKIEVSDVVIRRNLTALEIVLTGAAPDLYTYILTKQPSSSLAQNQPLFSNVEGALGIFSARSTVRQYKPVFSPPQTRCLDANSTKELCTGTYTTPLMFCSDIPLDNAANYYCN